MKLYMKESEDFEQYTYIKSKTVYDYDGFTTEYTMYYDEVNDRYVFVFGDSDFYNPNDGYEEFDWECDTEQDANEWFENYKGYEDDLDESICKESMEDIIADKFITLNLSFEEFADFVDSFGERTSTKTICKQIMKKFKFTYEEAKWILENWFAVDDLDESLKEDTVDVYDLSPKEIVGLIKDMLSKIKFKPVDLEQSVFNKDGTDTYYLVFDKIYKALGSNFYTETNYPIEISKTPILFRENNRGTISMLFINAGRIWKITKNGKVTTEAINPYSKKDTLIYIYNQLKELKGSSLGESLKETVNKKYNWFLVSNNYGKTVSVLPESDCDSMIEDFVINMLFDEVVTDEADEDLLEKDPEKFYQKYDVEEQIRAAKYDLTQEGNGLKISSGRYIIMKDSDYEGDLPYNYYIENGRLYNPSDNCVGKLENVTTKPNIVKESNDIEKLSLQDFYRWFDINYGGDLEDFRDYKLALTKAKVVRLKNNKYIFDTDEALKYNRNGQLK